MHAGLHRDGKQQRAEQHDGGDAFQHAAQDDEGHDGHRQETVAAAGHVGHQLRQVAREAGLRQRPGHGRGAAHDQHDGAGQRCGFDQHGAQARPVKAPVDQDADHRRIHDADGRDLGSGRHAFDHRGADHKGQGHGGQRNHEEAADLFEAEALHQAQVFLAIAPPHHRAQGQAQHHGGQQAAREQRGDRHARDRTDGDQHDGRRNGLGLRAGG
ncbi:hypothetical protein D3C77_536080 [compost metagenome]